MALETWKICKKCQKMPKPRGTGRRVQKVSAFICFPSGTCWQECEETGEGYAECDGAIYSITPKGLSLFQMYYKQ